MNSNIERAKRVAGRSARKIRREIERRTRTDEIAAADGQSDTPPAEPDIPDTDSLRAKALRAFPGRTPGAPLVTVIVPNYNDRAFVGACIESVKRQTFPDFECIVIDDASTDDSVAVINAAIGGDERFVLIRHVVNGGLSASRNTGLRLARSEFVCFLDGDDFFAPENLAVRCDALLDHVNSPALVGVFSRIAECQEDATIDDPLDGHSGAIPHFVDHFSARGACPFNCHAPLLRTEAIRRFGGFDETMRHGAEDWEFWLRLLRHGYWFRGVDRILAAYRQKTASMVRAMPGAHLAEAERLLHSVQAPLAAGEALTGTPAVWDKPLGHYDARMALARRVLTFSGMAAVRSDDSLDEALDRLDPLLWTAVKRHMRVEHLVDSGIRRAFSVDSAEYLARQDEAGPIRRDILGRLDARYEKARRERAAEVSPDSGPQVLFVPTTAAHTALMRTEAGLLGPETSARFLSLEPHAEQSIGAGERDQLDVVGVNPFLLGENTPDVIVVSWPYGPLVSDLIDRVTAAGGQSVELLVDGVDRLDESPGTKAEIGVQAGGVAETMAARRRDRQPMNFGTISAQRASLAAIEEYPHLPADIEEMASFRDRHIGERCVIIGNGPSLNELDLSLLEGETTIGVNGIFYADLPEPLTYYVVEDTSVMKENLPAIREVTAGHKFFPTIYREMWEAPTDNVTFFTMNRGFYSKKSPNYCVPRFSLDASQRLYCGQSVTIINLQLAHWMGFAEVVLIGMDFSYTIPESAEREGDLITSTTDDVNHFHPDYFGKGKTWKDPKLERVRNNYQLAREIYEGSGRRIVNATAGGNLDVFERVDFATLFARS